MGKHLLLEVYEVEFDLLNTLEPLLNLLRDSIQKANMTILNTYSHQFSPQGLTILICLEESHVSLHTFPEHNCVSIDVYTCGNGYPRTIARSLLTYFNSNHYRIRETTR